MKNAAATTRILILSAVLGIAFAGIAGAETIRLQIRFQFVAGTAVLPAGVYHVTVWPGATRMRIARANGSHVGLLTAVPVAADRTENTKLEFQKIGRAYALARVSVGNRTGLAWEMSATQVQQGLALAASAVASTSGQIVPALTRGNIIWNTEKPRR